MTNMCRAFISALGLSLAMAADEFEWKGVFYTPETSYQWLAQKKSGKYADPTMKLVAIPTSSATEVALTTATAAGNTALKCNCVDVKKGETITPMTNKCYRLVFDQTSSETVFKVDATTASSIAFFAEHVPTEFEETKHYFKDSTAADIEPVAQAPDAGHAHSHAHGVGKCVCQAKKSSWTLDCTNKPMIEKSVTNLKADARCKQTKPPQSPCIDNYYIMQAHHDHCLHDQLPIGIEKDLHDYEGFYDDCFIKRQFNQALSVCPSVNCASQKEMTNAIQTLQNSCAGNACATSPACGTAIKVVLMAHDTCAENQLPDNLEKALHDYEDACAKQLCNSATKAFNPYDEKCEAASPAGGPAPAPAPAPPVPGTCISTDKETTSAGYGIHNSLLATAFALPVAALLVV